jgi:6-phospho-3-hexuloisomerase
MTDAFPQSIDHIISHIEKLLSSVPPRDIHRIVTLLMKANRIFIYGTGRSGLLGRAFAIRLVHLGFQAFVIGETITAPVQKDDCVVLISGSGITIPVVMTAEIAANLEAKLILLTANKSSPIDSLSNVTIILSPCQKKSHLAPLGTLFEASSWIFLDGIIAELMKTKGEDEKTMRKRHAILE